MQLQQEGTDIAAILAQVLVDNLRTEMSEFLADQRHAHFTGVAEFCQFDQSVVNVSVSQSMRSR